jgi:hypothetical protein
MNLENLSADELEALEAQLAQKKKEKKEKERQEREAFKQLQHEYVEQNFCKLQDVEKNLSTIKAELFENVESILAMKKEVYGIDDKQQSHSISNIACTKTIIVGHNIVDGWDTDTAAAGVERVNQWLTKKLNDNNADLINIIRDLLKPNQEGILKANRVLELRNQAEKLGDQELISAVAVIQEAYRPKKTTTFIKAKYRNEHGQDVWLNLSMSNA